MGESPSTNDPLLWVPPGHYHSPIPDPGEVLDQSEALFDTPRREIPGVDLDEESQLELFHALRAFYGEEGFPDEAEPDRRYHAGNTFFGYGDAFVLYGMMRLFQPRRIIEVGSGFSSAVMLDTDERHLGRSVRYTFVEPHPERLHSLLRPEDHSRVQILEQRVQEVDVELFDELGSGDILFIDSSHVAKTASDVNHLFFHVLPRLSPGVLVHVHDVPHPFEYPRDWVEEGRAWNEVYLLRAFLQYNSAFRIRLHATFLATLNGDLAREWMPRCMEDLGSSLWMQRI